MLPWDELPDNMRVDAVRPYYDALVKKEKQLCLKRMFDVGIAVFLMLFFLIFWVPLPWSKARSDLPQGHH